MLIQDALHNIQSTLPKEVKLVAVSKTKPQSDILTVYNAGHKIFGENKVQELCAKYEALPKDIEWHLIGHLQKNKVKYVVPFVQLIHGVDNIDLYNEIAKRASAINKKVNILLQVYIADETTKFGFNPEDLTQAFQKGLLEHPNVNICGLMGMATNTNDETKIHQEFTSLHNYFNKLKTISCTQSTHFTTLSMGMSGDYKIALKCGSNLVRIGSSIFGNR